MTREFENSHPIIIFVYCLSMIVITMITMNPLLLGVSLAASFGMGIFLKGQKFIKENVVIAIPVFIFTVIIQPIFSHSGKTPLFYINDSAVFFEGYVYGGVVFVLLFAIIQWCNILNYLIDSEKMMYLFGKFLPNTGLIFSMIMRFVPLMRMRLKQIHEAQMGMGRNSIKTRIKELSILVTWSLESSIETSTSMEARGYGLRGRTSYHRFTIRISEIFTVAMMIIMWIMSMVIILFGKEKVYYLPVIHIEIGECSFVAAATISILALIPIIIEIIEKIRHRKYYKVF